MHKKTDIELVYALEESNAKKELIRKEQQLVEAILRVSVLKKKISIIKKQIKKYK